MAKGKGREKPAPKYTPKEKQDYHFEMSKPGATKQAKDINGHSVKIPVSDFERGMHRAKGENILAARRRKKLGG